jgi:hypothetical protein
MMSEELTIIQDPEFDEVPVPKTLLQLYKEHAENLRGSESRALEFRKFVRQFLRDRAQFLIVPETRAEVMTELHFEIQRRFRRDNSRRS